MSAPAVKHEPLLHLAIDRLAGGSVLALEQAAAAVGKMIESGAKLTDT